MSFSPAPTDAQRHLTAFVLAVMLPGAALADSATTTRDGWTAAARLLNQEAFRDFTDLAESDQADEREANFGLAISLLGIQPKTRENVDRAASLFDELGTATPEDRFTAPARYYRARLEQVHRFEPNPAKAADLFEALYHDHPEHPLGQEALVKVALIRLYEDVDPDEIERRMSHFRELAATLSAPSPRRDLYLTLATAEARHFGESAKSLDDLLAADRLGIARPITRADAWVRIAEVARKVGRAPVAREYYERFLATFPRDSRHYLVTERLASLNQQPLIE